MGQGRVIVEDHYETTQLLRSLTGSPDVCNDDTWGKSGGEGRAANWPPVSGAKLQPGFR